MRFPIRFAVGCFVFVARECEVRSGWAVYRRENDVIAREVVILEGITTGLTFDEVQTLTPPYEEDADISEWHATVHDIQGWLAAHS